MFNLSRGRPPFVKRFIQLSYTLLQLIFLCKLHGAQSRIPDYARMAKHLCEMNYFCSFSARAFRMASRFFFFCVFM